MLVEVPDMDTLQKAMGSAETADAMKFDGVRPETVLILVEHYAPAPTRQIWRVFTD